MNFVQAEVAKIFKEETGIDIPFYPFFRIDIIKLDKKLQTPDNKSMKAFIEEQYGDKAVRAIEELIAQEKKEVGNI